jgi:hypothetical protein
MPLVLADRVQQTGTANTTVSFTLSGAVTGFRSFSVIGNTNTTYYAATDTSGNWEVGIGTYSTTGPTLTRTTILSSSNAGNAVTFSGTVNVFVTYPSSRSVTTDGTEPLTNKRVTPRVLPSTANSATPTINTDLYDIVVITNQSATITNFSTNLSGSPTNGQKLWISITGTAAVGITWGTSFESSTVTLPTTTVGTARLDVGFVWNPSPTNKWRCVAQA